MLANSRGIRVLGIIPLAMQGIGATNQDSDSDSDTEKATFEDDQPKSKPEERD